MVEGIAPGEYIVKYPKVQNREKEGKWERMVGKKNSLKKERTSNVPKVSERYSKMRI